MLFQPILRSCCVINQEIIMSLKKHKKTEIGECESAMPTNADGEGRGRGDRREGGHESEERQRSDVSARDRDSVLKNLVFRNEILFGVWGIWREG